MNFLLLAMTPADVERMLAGRVRAARKARGWSQAELARRSGLGVATVARFEQSGLGQFSSLVRMCAALERLEDFDSVLREPAPATLEELRRLRSRP
jgi:transcriptional regulator with XRE-family HTH domain